MKIVGLITEYNPFHKGHEYHIQKAKELTGADACVVIMSGNYVQRGTPAFMDKHVRTRIALNHGADVVFELPLPFSCLSAEYFANAAVTLLNKMGVINYICFGSECDDISKLQHIAAILADAKENESHPLNVLIRENLKTGMSYASARSASLSTYLSSNCSDIVDKPNNILGIEYLKSLILLKSDIQPVIISRTQATYHDDTSNDKLYSASSLRNAIMNISTNDSAKDSYSEALPILRELFAFDNCYRDTLGKTAPITENDFSHITGERLLSASSLSDYMGIDNDLANRMSDKDILYSHTGFTDLIERVKTKNVAYTSVSRALLALTLDIKKSDVDSYIKNGISSYIRLLGFRKASSDILNAIKKNGELIILGQLSELNDKLQLSSVDQKMLSHSIYCDELYNMMIRSKYNIQIPNEYSKKLVIL